MARLGRARPFQPHLESSWYTLYVVTTASASAATAATGTAYNATVITTPNAGLATATGTARAPSIIATPFVGHAVARAYDTFAGLQLDASTWTPTVTGNVTATYGPSYAKFVFPASATGSDLGYLTSIESYDLRDSYVQVGMLQVTSTSAGDNHTQLVAEATAGGSGAFAIEIYQQSIFFSLYSSTGFFGSGPDYSSNVGYNATTDLYWRIRESRGTLYWDTSADGLTWTNRDSHASPFSATQLASMHIIVGSGIGGSGATNPGENHVANLVLGGAVAHYATVQDGPTLSAAIGTGTAQAPVPTVIPPAGAAQATGTAFGATPQFAVTATGGFAQATASAYGDAIDEISTSGAASATAASGAPSPQLTSILGAASGTGTALDPTITAEAITVATAGLAQGTGTAFDDSILETSNGGNAAATGAAGAPSAALTVLAGIATATASAYGASVVEIANAGSAPAIGASGAPSPQIAVGAGIAQATATAFDATGSGNSTTTATAGIATASASASGPAASEAPSLNTASGIAVGLAPLTPITVALPQAQAAGTAFGATVVTGTELIVTAGRATATATAHQPLIQADGVENFAYSVRAADPRWKAHLSQRWFTESRSA